MEGDALVFHPGLGFEEERESDSAAQRISSYTSDRNLTAWCVRSDGRHGSDSDLHTCPPQSNGHVSSEVEGLKLAQGVETDEKCVSPSFIEGNGTHTASNIENLRTVKPEEKSDTIPEFIMPFAPLSTGNTFLHHGVLKEDVSQADVSHQGIIIDTCLKPSIVSGRDLKYKDDSSEDRFIDQSSSSSDGPSMRESGTKYSNTCDISKQLSNFILLTGERSVLSINKRVAYVTLDLDEHRDLNRSYFSNHVNAERQNCSCAAQPIKDKMPHKTSRTSDGKARSKHKDQPADPHGIHISKKQEKPPSEKKGEFQATGCVDGEVTVIETIVITEKITPKVHGKKKKKHVQHGATKPDTEPTIRTTQKNTTSKTENLEIKVASNGLDKPDAHLSTREDTGDKNSTQKPMSVRPKVEASCSIVAKKMVQANTDTGQKIIAVKPKADISRIDVGKNQNHTCNSSQSTCLSGTISDEIKRRRIANDLPGTIPVKTRPQLPAIFRQARKDGEEVAKRAYSEVVKQKTPTPKEGSLKALKRHHKFIV